MRLFSFLFVSLMALCVPALACGPETDCHLGNRHYRIALPEGYAGQASLGAIVFAHGYRGSAEGTMRNPNLRKMAADMGLALVAVKSAGDDWDLPGSPGNLESTGAAERAYFDAVVADVTERFGIDPDRIMMSGFSAGGMVTWELACHRPTLFAGYVPLSGTFWQGPPDTCAAPANIIHFHGTADRIVPLAGRRIGDTRQGDIAAVLSVYRTLGSFGSIDRVAVLDDVSCERQSNAAGKLLEFCTFAGGHAFRSAFISYAWDRVIGARHN